MTKFIKSNFQYHGGYLTYNGRVIARFRHGGKVQFQKFLIENFTEEEYEKLTSQGLAPLQVLHTKGYISPNVRKVLASYNLPPTQEGIKSLHEINRRESRI